MERVVHFEIYADDVERAADFYRSVFDWKIEKYEDLAWEYWMVMTDGSSGGQVPEGAEATPPAAPGINGGLMKRPQQKAPAMCGANAFVCTVAVEDFERTAEKIQAAGGTIAMPKFAIPGMAWQGYFNDTEGNTFGIHQPDTEAK